MQPERKALTATAVHALFRKIPSDDLQTLGLSATEAHPSWMIITVLPVPPPPVRPSIAVDGGTMRGEDDLTYKLAEIIRTNTSLRKCEEEGVPAHVISEYETLLQVTPHSPSPSGRGLYSSASLSSTTPLPTWITISLVSLKRCRSQVVQSNRFELD